MDRQAVHEETERARPSFHQLLNGASDADLTDGLMAPGGTTSSCCSTCCLDT
jgi:hypothetical protein